MKSAGRLLIIETILPTGNTPHPGKILDTIMLAVTGGQERTEPEYRVLLEKAGRHTGQLIGKSPWLQSVHVVADGAHIGDMIEVEIVSAGPNSLGGETVNRKEAA